MSRDMTDRAGRAFDEVHELRLDVWLDVACLFKTRSDAQAACRNRKLSVNGQVAKPNRRLHVGDEIENVQFGAVRHGLR